jgi:DNA mismatch repair protein MutS
LVPPYFQRKQTLANGERYVTEELLRLESQVLGAEEKLASLEEEIYQQLLKEIGQTAKRVQETSHILAQLDVLQSFAELAIQNSYVRPRLLAKEENLLQLEDLRHPAVEKMLPEAAYVPNDLIMPAQTDFYIITGPNMGGKSTYCRSVALAVIMAQIGSFVPARRAVISLRDRVFARVGASDDLRSGQSTFMVEMNEVANILNHATRFSLVILDEVGRGTSTYDGLSMAWAVSEYLIRHIAAKTLFATHYHELTRLSTQYETVENLSVSVQEKGEEIIFLHKIIPGAADKSYGIQVARLAGLPSSVVQRAKEILRVMEEEKQYTKNMLKTRNVTEGDLTEQNLARELQQLEKEKERIAKDYQDLKDALSRMDIFSMTPLEALNKLSQIQELVKNA